MAQQNNHSELLKIKASNSSNFSCKNCPVDHGARGCIKAEKKAPFDFDFNKLLPILQKRFVEIATVYEKSKLQRVNKWFNQQIKPDQYKIVNELIVHSNTSHPIESEFWGIRGSTSHIHPESEKQREQVKDLIINKKFNGVFLPDQWLTKVLEQNVTFYLTKLHINDCNLTGPELKAVCDYGMLESIFLDRIVVEPPPKAYELAMWSTNVKKFHVNIKNFVCEANWAKYFTQFSDKRCIRLFEFSKLSPSFSANDWDKFIRTRIISTKERDDFRADISVRIGFDTKYVNHMKKKSFEKKLDRIFVGVYKRVPKVQYETFKSIDRFMVDGKREEKSCKTYFFVNCRAIDLVMKELEEQKIAKDFHGLKV